MQFFSCCLLARIAIPSLRALVSAQVAHKSGSPRPASARCTTKVCYVSFVDGFGDISPCDVLVCRGNAPAVYLAQANGLGRRPPHPPQRANGPTVCSRSKLPGRWPSIESLIRPNPGRWPGLGKSMDLRSGLLEKMCGTTPRFGDNGRYSKAGNRALLFGNQRRNTGVQQVWRSSMPNANALFAPSITLADHLEFITTPRRLALEHGFGELSD